MPGPTTVLNSGKTLGDICRVAELSDEALALLADGTDGRGYVERLVAVGNFGDAVRVLAHALPQRPAVWWAWYCARRAHGESPPAPVEASLEATKQWIAEPVEKNRREAMRWAREVEFRTPAGSRPGAAGRVHGGEGDQRLHFARRSVPRAGEGGRAVSGVLEAGAGGGGENAAMGADGAAAAVRPGWSSCV